MKRFLMLVGVAAVAGAMYVAAAPGGRQSTAPTARQFAALKKQVARLSKSVKALKKDEGTVKKLALGEAEIIVGCLAYHAQAVDEFGDGANGTFGYQYQDPQQNSGVPFNVTALDFAPSTDTSADDWFLAVNPTCASSINSNSPTLRHLSKLSGVRLPRHAPLHASLATHRP
jgi:hypothetical protein